MLQIESKPSSQNRRRMNSIIGFLSCTTLHTLYRGIPLRTPRAANLLTCITFQVFFVLNAIRIYFNPSVEDTSDNLDYLVGYFGYDLMYLLQTHPYSLYVVHHLIGLGLVHLIQKLGIPTHLVQEYNAICISLEFVNPFLNLLSFSKQTAYYPLLLRFNYKLYILFRIIMFPGVSYQLRTHFSSPWVWTCFFAIYGMSLGWVWKMRALIQRN